MVNPQPVGHASQSFLSFNHKAKTGVQWHDVLQLDKINPTFLFARIRNAMKMASLTKKTSDILL